MSADPNALLAFKQSNLKERLEVYREEIANGERQIADLRRKQASYEERLNAVASEWNTLQDDIVAMVERTGGARASTTRASSSASTADIKDPFLRRLFDLAGADAIAGRKRARDDDGDKGAADKDGGSATDSEDEDGAAAKEGGPDDDAVKAVDAIKAKAAATKAALVTVLDAVDERSSGDAAGAAGADLIRSLEARAADATRALERCRERTAKQRKRNEELASRLEDAQAECELLRRSLAAARANAGHHEGLPPMATAAGARAAGAAAQAAAAAANTPGGGQPQTPGTAVKTSGGEGGDTAVRTPAATPADAPDANAVARLEADLAELRGRLAHQTKQLDEASRREASLTGELHAVRDGASGGPNRSGEPNTAASTAAYQSLERRAREAEEDASGFRAECQKLRREADEARRDLRSLRAEAARAGEHARRAQLAEERIEGAEARRRAVCDERDELATRLASEAESASRRRLHEERAAAVERLGEENKALRREAEAARSLKGELASARARAANAEAEAKNAKDEASNALQALERVEKKTPPAEGSAEELKRLLDAANARAELAEAKALAAQAELAAKSEETDAFVAEVEAIGAAYEESQSETARLMQRLTERDGTEAKAIQDAANANNRARRLGDELAGAEAAARHEQGVARAAAQRCADAEAARAEQSAELQRAKEESTRLAERLEEQTRTMRALQAASSGHREAAEDASKKADELSRRSAGDAEKVAAAERKVAALEEQVAGLKRRGEKLLKRGGGADEYREEIDAYKSMLRCSVCNDRPKACIITRCYHMFCQECVQVRLDNRDRKCPGCAAAFSASDVKSIYF
ncbi:predicted protein [Micromonas commoda]|uniref:E3 ubiquitin protein ligase n=1 Tax=Micromonas commoda (strain RCC299 / NOUM17 / CCMP2709) TaxID=296587 RepID=C1EGY6_MICCC|nr:predicted protein [Micromonas commoda]ACO67409.1 predicted protein [Micromonas commoda]|eukprot:XP_002506151.1 predicted protein [Micromonas commoda]